MTIYEFAATISPGQTHEWWTGGGAWYSHDLTPQLDAHARPVFPEGTPHTGLGVVLWFGDFKSKLETADFFGNETYTYFVTVKNLGHEPTLYHMRVWVP